MVAGENKSGSTKNEWMSAVAPITDGRQSTQETPHD
jgi:hypothetical protein